MQRNLQPSRMSNTVVAFQQYSDMSAESDSQISAKDHSTDDPSTVNSPDEQETVFNEDGEMAQTYNTPGHDTPRGQYYDLPAESGTQISAKDQTTDISKVNSSDQLETVFKEDGEMSQTNDTPPRGEKRLANLEKAMEDRPMEKQCHDEVKDTFDHREVDVFASYMNRNIYEERQEKIKNYTEIKKSTSDDDDVSEISQYYPASHFHNQDESIITTKAEFAREAIRKAEKDDLISLLRRRSMHLPGNNWYQDWIQYIRNNHPLLGICLHHPLHPLRMGQRIYILLASVSFGLLATNLVYLYFMFSSEDYNAEVFRVYMEYKGDGDYRPIEISQGMISLWMTNGVLHALFDVSLWYMSSCTCFQHRENFLRLQKVGSYFVVAISAVICAISSFFIICRAILASENEMGVNNEEMRGFFLFESCGFVIGYIVELCCVYFLIYPMLITVMFSGIFGCIPFMGGRPRDVVRYLNRLLVERNQMYIHGDFEIV